MSIGITDKFKPKNNGTFPIIDAVDVEMPDGTRLSDSINKPNPYLQAEGALQLQPETYYVFGIVNTLSVTLVEADDGRVHEYCFEFIPTEDFDGLTISPEPAWIDTPQIVPGKTHQVSILRGIGVMGCA